MELSLVWQKARSIGYPMRIELINNSLLVYLVNRYTKVILFFFMHSLNFRDTRSIFYVVKLVSF